MMNKTALKNFAVNARKDLLKRMESRALKLGISENDIVSSDSIFIAGKPLSPEEKGQREKLINFVHQVGLRQVIEETAYSWFNRFTAIHYMKVNDFLPTSLKWNIETEEKFKCLIIKHCNELNRYLPIMFETIDDCLEILFPEGLLAKDSFFWHLTNLPEENWLKVEVIGWLYQYYMGEEKDKVIKAKKKYKTKEIPFATQLFTPDWIVKYMVQNSLGRYWIESHPEHRDLIAKWEFYLENPNPEEDFAEKMTPYLHNELKVEEIKCFDPAMGTGHILVYLFDVLYEIYLKCGYPEKEIPRLIIENNLYGLDIDDRAYKLACFSVVMKAMEYDPAFFKRLEREGLTINLASIQETNSLNEEDIRYIAGADHTGDFERTKQFIDQFREAKTFGSLIKVYPYNVDEIERRLQQLKDDPTQDKDSRERVLDIVPRLIKQFHIMNHVYDVLVTNPPYMGNRYMNKQLGEFVKKHYSKTKMDLFSAFIEYSFHKVHQNGHLAFMSPFVWMFIGIYEPLRKMIVTEKSISSLVQLEYSAFEDATVPICTYTMRNSFIDVPGEYIKLSEFKGSKNQPEKLTEAIQNQKVDYRFRIKTKLFSEIPGNPIAYWISDDLREIFKHNSLHEFSISDGQNVTGNNEKYVRFFWEVSKDKIGRNKKWVFYAKGGGFRKWAGNLDNVVDWSIEAREHYRKDPICRIIPEYLWYKKGITWGLITSNLPSFRVLPEGTTFDKGGSSIFLKDYSYYPFFLALLNSKIFLYLANILNPTLNFQVKDVRAIPIILPDDDAKQTLDRLVDENIKISEDDWNSFETSFHFAKHPFLRFKNFTSLISEAFLSWNRSCRENFNRLKTNEQKINNIIFELYKVTDIVPEVEDKDITVSIANRKRDVRSFISYAIGCMFGRYSLDFAGLINTGDQLDWKYYKTFIPDEIPILPIGSGDDFKDDIVQRFSKFVEISFGGQTLAENLDFIADVLGRKEGETAKQTIRRYFVSDFFKDHVHTYKKRPIYWLFTSGKQRAFTCLVYLPRIDQTTFSRLRTDYLPEYQIRLENRKKGLRNLMDEEFSIKEISHAKKELQVLDTKIEELKQYEELLHQMADQKLEIHLDDGIAANYGKFNGLVAKI
jgi:type II restriction/modification system DNA methylase subunit YeeA